MERTLPAESLQAFDLHLANCISCSALLTEFNQMEMIIEQEKAAEPNPFTGTRILQHLENTAESQTHLLPHALIRYLMPVAVSIALISGIIIGSYTANKDHTGITRQANVSENIQFLRSNLFITEFADEDNIMVLNR